MKENVQITIDAREVSVPAGTTILQAAEKAGIEIPRLCHQEGISPSGNCRICVVEVEGSRGLVGSCHTPVARGMVVKTRSERVLEARKATVELLLTAHTGACVNDEDAGECKLHKLAADLEAGPPRFHVKKPRFYEAEKGPYVARDMSRCILCRKCVRACAEVAGRDIYGMAYRGFRSKVVVDFDVPLDKEACKDCGVCIEYCPTSALRYADGSKRGRDPSKKGDARAVPGAPGGKRERLLDLLKARQRADGFVGTEAMAEIAEESGLSRGEVFGVASFYSFLSVKQRGRHTIRVCKSLPCYLENAPMIVRSVAASIGIGPGETTADGKFSFELTNCIGACDQAPAMLVDDEVYGNLTPGKIADVLASYRDV